MSDIQLKYTDTMVTFSEVPDEVTLCINISNCPNHCPACHSKELWGDIGDPLTDESLTQLINKNKGISCVSFMGGDINKDEIIRLGKFVKANFGLKTCWYSGVDRPVSELDEFANESFDYIKVGPYIEERGGLDSETTNQTFFKIEGNIFYDLTYLFYGKH